MEEYIDAFTEYMKIHYNPCFDIFCVTYRYNIQPFCYSITDSDSEFDSEFDSEYNSGFDSEFDCYSVCLLSFPTVSCLSHLLSSVHYLYSVFMKKVFYY